MADPLDDFNAYDTELTRRSELMQSFIGELENELQTSRIGEIIGEYKDTLDLSQGDIDECLDIALECLF